jgi:glycosyltransferase involved in cell wall biosynthesis
MRRILLLITDLQIGGTPTVVRELAIRLTAAGGAVVEVACLSPWGPVADQLKQAGICVTALNAAAVHDFPRVVWILAHVIRDHGIDTVFSFLVHANAVAAAASRFCRGVRWLQSIQTTQPTPKWHWTVQSLVQHAAERIVVPSPSVAQVARDWAGVAAEKIVVVPNAVEVKTTGGPPVPRTVSLTHPRIGFIGRLDPIKRIPDLLQAMTLLAPSAQLHIFGEGAQRELIEETIQRLNLGWRVTLHGTVDRPADALSQIDVLVLPSQAEGFGLVLIEAMAAGVPVVATDVPGICDVIRDGETGLLVPVASPESLARAINRIIDDANLRQRLISNGVEDVRRRFSWDVLLPQYRKLLEF